MSDRKAARDVCIERLKRYEQTDKSYRNALEDEKQLQRNHQERKNMECCKNAQPVFDSERQLAGKVVDEKAIGDLQCTGYITPQHMMLIDTILTIPGTTVEAETQCRIDAINAIVAFCDVEDGAPLRSFQSRKRAAAETMAPTQIKKREGFFAET